MHKHCNPALTAALFSCKLSGHGCREAMAVSLRKQALETEEAPSQADEPDLQKGLNTTRKVILTGAERRLNAGKSVAAPRGKSKAAAARKTRARAENRRQAHRD